MRERRAYLLELVEFRVGLVRRLVGASLMCTTHDEVSVRCTTPKWLTTTHLGKDLLEACEDSLFMELVAIELKSFDELLDGAVGFEREK